jgi:hypothetical protein
VKEKWNEKMTPEDVGRAAPLDEDETAQIDALAAFADLVLDDQPGHPPDSYPPDHVGEGAMPTVKTIDQTERALQETVLTLRQSPGRRQPDEAMARRIWARLVAEWLTLPKPEKQNPRLERFLSVLRSFTRPRQTRVRMAFAFAAMLILFLFLLPFVGSLDVSLPGAAGGVPGAAGNNALPLFIFVLALAGGVVWWLARREK